MPLAISEIEKKVYDNEVRRLSEIINALKQQRDNIEIAERNSMAELDLFVKALQNMHSSFKDASYVQKAQIFDLFFLNITVGKDFSLSVAVKPEFKNLFIQESRGCGTRTRDLLVPNQAL